MNINVYYNGNDLVIDYPEELTEAEALLLVRSYICKKAAA